MSDGSQPRHREEATRSWWLEAETREAFNDAVEREAARMRRSKAASGVSLYTVGWSTPRARRSM